MSEVSKHNILVNLCLSYITMYIYFICNIPYVSMIIHERNGEGMWVLGAKYKIEVIKNQNKIAKYNKMAKPNSYISNLPTISSNNLP